MSERTVSVADLNAIGRALERGAHPHTHFDRRDPACIDCHGTGGFYVTQAGSRVWWACFCRPRWVRP